jgi:hypothetical protein
MEKKKLIEAIRKARRDIVIKVHHDDSYGGCNEYEKIVYVDANVLIQAISES